MYGAVGCALRRLSLRACTPQNQFDCVDLSDNELVKLEAFPPLKRLSTLLAHNNRIARVSPSLGGAPPSRDPLFGSRPAVSRTA